MRPDKPLTRWREQTSTVYYYLFNNTGVIRQVKCRQSNGALPHKSLKQIRQIVYKVKVMSYSIKRSV